MKIFAFTEAIHSLQNSVSWRDPQGSSSDQSQHESLCPIQLPRSPWGPDSPCLCVPQMGTLPHQNVFSMASPHSRGLGQSCEVSHGLSHKEKQPLFLIFTGTVSSKSFFLWQLSILMKHTVSHGKICDVFYRLLNTPQKTDLKNEWRPIPLKADFPCQENKKNIWINLVGNSSKMMEVY